jgi:hypothetical protein
MEPFSILTFLGGFNIFNGAKLAKLLFYGILIAVGIGIYHKTFVAPTYKTVQSIQIKDHQPVTIYQDQKPKKDNFIGVQVWKIKLGVGW